MSEKDLGQAMLRGEGPIDVGALSAGVARRDRRWIWVMGSLCVAAWMMVVMIPWAGLLPILAKLAEHQRELEPNLRPGEETLLMAQVRQATMLIFFTSVGSMLVAAVCTVSFITLTRRATLRQVSGQLAEISAQIRRMGKGEKG